MLPRGLPIVVPLELQGVSILPNLLSFNRSINEDLAAHIERFVEILITSLVTNHGYYLIWFPMILIDFAYTCYRSHVERAFTKWKQFLAAFLHQYRPVIGQQ